MNEDDITIRPYEPEDIEDIEEITIAAWKPAYQAYRDNMGAELFEAKYGDWMEFKRTEVATQCREHPERTRVAVVAGDIAGFVTFQFDGNGEIGVIGNNAVHPSYQGRGIATTMYEHILDEFRSRNIPFAQVRTGLTEEYAGARQAYENVGFDIERPVVTYWQQL